MFLSSVAVDYFDIESIPIPQNRDIANQDLVVWYTQGFHHVPSSEDWPVYKTGFHGVTLKPYNFFDRSPAIDVPPRP